MKRAIWLTLAILAVGFLVFYLRSWAPFMGISGTSMEPEFRVGDLVLVEQISPLEVKEGDVIIFEIPTLVREHYNYPLLIAHRVIEIVHRDDGMIFRTKGDNTGEDPFIVRTVDLKGVVGKKISHLGFLLLFLQSRQLMVSIAVILFLIGLRTFGQEIGLIKRRVQKEVFSPVLEEQQKTKQALDGFSGAMAEYAKHLESHTKAVKDLAKATGKLSKVTERLYEKLGGESESNKKSG